tara:strand:+ start:149 stop:520 length:372 start_codon:yes stop_codon:yes gene_type:complete
MNYDINDSIDESLANEDQEEVAQEAPPPSDGPDIRKSGGTQNRRESREDPDKQLNADFSMEEDEDNENDDFLDPGSPKSISDGGLSELSNEQTYFDSKLIYQKRALFHQKLALQLRSKAANCV